MDFNGYDFKAFATRVAAGPVLELFLFPRRTEMLVACEQLFDALTKAGLKPEVNVTHMRAKVGDRVVAYLDTAHEEVSYRFAGLGFTAAHGLDLLGEPDRQRLSARIGRPLG